VWQRGTSLTALIAGSYTADGWIVVPSGASVTVSQAGGRLLTKNSLQVTGASSVTDVIVKQRIESLIAATFCSQTVTVQAQVFNNTGATITPLLTVKHATAQDNWSGTTTDVNGASLQSCANGAWTQIAYTFSASASSYNGLEIAFDFGNNFSTSGKSIQITELDIRATPGVTIGLNSAPPPPELRPVTFETAFCQRYYQVSPPLSIAWQASGIAAFGSWSYAVQMRAAATLSLLNGSAVATQANIASGINVSAASTFASSTVNGQQFALTTDAVTVPTDVHAATFGVINGGVLSARAEL
jgi:hypothetical protein